MGTSSPPQKGAETPLFGPRLLWPNGCMDQDAIGTEICLSLRDIVLDGDQLPCPKGARPPNFRPMSAVAKWLMD